MPRRQWIVEIAEEFEPELARLPVRIQDEIMAHALLIEHFGPSLGRPRVDTLKGSMHANLKELRFQASRGEWRVAFAFDPRRRAVLLAAGNKSGTSSRRFYERLITAADLRFAAHLDRLTVTRKPKAR